MIRILFDEYGNGHKDIILKVDVEPVFCQVADTYFISGFLGGDTKTKEKAVIDYLNYFKDKINNLTTLESFIIFDLSDQYIGGFIIAKWKKGLLKVKYVTNQSINGFSVNDKNIEEEIKENKNDFEIENDWLISAKSILDGIEFSIKRIVTAYNSGQKQ